MTFLNLNAIDLELPVGQRSIGNISKPDSDISGDRRINFRNGKGYVRALVEVSLNLEPGSRVGLVGVNGSGKSTLLRVLSGIYQPTRGSYAVEGKISTLFTNSVGMNENATGRENIFLSARVLGLSRQEIAHVQPEIIAFAKLGEFIDLPIRLYSAGMKTRLGFAVATALNPEILLIDEVFGVGDAAFNEQARERVANIMGKAGILVMASHSNRLIEQFCNKVCWLDKGKVLFFGDTQEGLEAYGAFVRKK